MTVGIGTLSAFHPPVIPDFGWESGLGSLAYTVNGVNYPPTVTAYSAAVNYTHGADVMSGGNEYICLQPNGPATTVVTPGTNITIWKKIPFRFFYYQTPLLISVTFDAVDNLTLNLPKVYCPAGISIINYAWDFGNGSTGIGPTAITTYNYNQPPPDMKATLTVTDNLGRVFSVAHYLALESGISQIGFGLAIGPPTT